MKRLFIAFLLSVLLVVPAAADEVFNFQKQGYGFVIDATSIGAVGLLEPLQTQNPPFDFDFANFQITWALQDMVITDYNEFGSLQIWDMAGGVIGVYEDSNFDLDYGLAPATGLATGTNGTAALTGFIYSAGYIFNSFTETGTFSGRCFFDGGTRLAELGPLAQFDWEIFDGTSAQIAVNVPQGYHTRFAGRIFTNFIVPVESSTMSQLKSLY